MKKLSLLIVILININVVFADPSVDYIKKMLDSLEVIKQNNPNFSKQDYFNFMNGVREVAINMNGGNTYAEPNDFDIQFDVLRNAIGITHTVVKRFVLPSNDTNSISIVWQNGLPRTGVLSNVIIRNKTADSNNYSKNIHSGGVIDTIKYFVNTQNPIFDDLFITLPEISHNFIEWIHNEDCNFKLIDVLSGNNVIDTMIIGVEPEQIETINVGGISIANPKFASDVENTIIDISNVPYGLYFVVFINSQNEVIYIKTLNRLLDIIK